MEFFPRPAAAAPSAPVVAEFADHQLAERIVEIRGIEGAAPRLLFRGRVVAVGFLAK